MCGRSGSLTSSLPICKSLRAATPGSSGRIARPSANMALPCCGRNFGCLYMSWIGCTGGCGEGCDRAKAISPNGTRPATRATTTKPKSVFSHAPNPPPLPPAAGSGHRPAICRVSSKTEASCRAASMMRKKPVVGHAAEAGRLEGRKVEPRQPRQAPTRPTKAVTAESNTVNSKMIGNVRRQAPVGLAAEDQRIAAQQAGLRAGRAGRVAIPLHEARRSPRRSAPRPAPARAGSSAARPSPGPGRGSG